MWLKVWFYSTVFVSVYFLLLWGNFAFPVMLGLFILLGLFTAFIGLNISHDAAHGSISDNKTVNKFLAYSFNVIGANSYIWKCRHNHQPPHHYQYKRAR